MKQNTNDAVLADYLKELRTKLDRLQVSLHHHYTAHRLATHQHGMSKYILREDGCGCANGCKCGKHVANLTADAAVQTDTHVKRKQKTITVQEHRQVLDDLRFKFEQDTKHARQQHLVHTSHKVAPVAQLVVFCGRRKGENC